MILECKMDTQQVIDLLERLRDVNAEIAASFAQMQGMTSTEVLAHPVWRHVVQANTMLINIIHDIDPFMPVYDS